jgi:hypothetical protein
MKHREIVAAFASFAMIAVVAGCSTTSTAARSDGSTATSGVIEQRPTELAGLWRGEFYQVGGDAQLEGQVTLEVKEDGTYQMTARRWGAGNIVESGVIETRGNSVTLKSSSGASTPLQRSGEKMYGMTLHTSGRPIKIMVERVKS